jgi:8-hydroxy-5-deazaflavin:NADPH oxidoreductase
MDAANFVRQTPEPYHMVYHNVVDRTGVDMVKCFNSNGYENMVDPVYNGKGTDMFMAGDSIRAKETAKQLAIDTAFNSCFDFGKGDKVELFEKFALSWINLAIFHNLGRNIAFRLVSR